jgi:hypothetical protein
MFSAVYQVIDTKCFKFSVTASRSFCASMPVGALYGSFCTSMPVGALYGSFCVSMSVGALYGSFCASMPVGALYGSFCASMSVGALYGSLILYVSPASVRHTVVNAFKDITNFKLPSVFGSLDFQLSNFKFLELF